MLTFARMRAVNRLAGMLFSVAVATMLQALPFAGDAAADTGCKAAIPGPPQRFYSIRDPQFACDEERALKTLHGSKFQAKIGVLERVMRLIIGHELGHQFERTHTRFAGLSEEDFADFFSVNLDARINESLAGSYGDTDEDITVFNIFLTQTLTSGHLGINLDIIEGATPDIGHRRSVMSCAHFGYFAAYLESDPYDHLAVLLGLPPAAVPTLKARARDAGPIADWIKIDLARRPYTRDYLNKLVDPDQKAQLDNCKALERRFNAYFADSVWRGRDPRTGLSSSVANDLQVEYQRPPSEGAQDVFAAFMPHKDGAVSGLSYIDWVLSREGFAPGDPRFAKIRLEDCGIGVANAHLHGEGNQLMVQLCYGIGEEILRNLWLYPNADSILRGTSGDKPIEYDTPGAR
jgi:hypothetical protein